MPEPALAGGDGVIVQIGGNRRQRLGARGARCTDVRVDLGATTSVFGWDPI